MRVLVFVPVMRGRFYKVSLDSMLALEPLEPKGQVEYHFLIGGDTAKRHPFDNLTRKCQEARRLVLDAGYDALMSIETDVIVPPDALKSLVAVDTDVAYGLVVHGHGWPVWNAATKIDERMAVPISMFPEKAKEAWGKVVEVDGVGSSCILIHRRVLEKINFRREHTPEFIRSCDWYFAKDCKAEGFAQKCDTRVICGHIQTDLRPRILWPDIMCKGFYRSQVIGPFDKEAIMDPEKSDWKRTYMSEVRLEGQSA